MPDHYRKKPVEVEAVCYGPYSMPTVEMHAFLGPANWVFSEDGIIIKTLEGEMLASVGDWIIKGVKGEFYPCKPDIFAATYEPVAPIASLPSDDEVGRVQRLRENLASFDAEVAYELSTDGERADLWGEIDVSVEDLRVVLALIQSQAAELAAANERVTAAVDDYNDALARAERAEAALAEKDKALEPFASMAALYDPEEGDDDQEVWAYGARPTIGHLRAARRAHSKDGGEHG